jgi:LPXTG-site transpeptidase (sortase) family protein
MLISKIKNNINRIIKNIKKSQVLLFGSLLIFIGIIALSWNSILALKTEIYSDMIISFSDTDKKVEKIEEVPVTNEVVPVSKPATKKETYKPIDYSKYLGVLRIPKINLKRGFYNVDSRYNSIEYNVTLLKGSDMPDVKDGNLVLMAHSGTAWISFFDKLYKLEKGDKAYIDYKGYEYAYTIRNIYNVPKNGYVSIVRNYNKTTLTMITCTRNDDKSQTVYIAEME